MQIGNVKQVAAGGSAGSKESSTAVSAAIAADTVSISRQGLRASLMACMGLDLKADSISIADIERVVRQDTAAIRKTLDSIAAEMGIRAEFELSSGYDGSIAVQGAFAGREILEQRLNADDDFSATFRRLDANSCLLEACRESLEFQRAYAVDPEKAVAEFMHLLDDKRTHSFTLSYAADGISTAVKSGF